MKKLILFVLLLAQPAWAQMKPVAKDARPIDVCAPIGRTEDGKLVRKHACIDGPEIDGHAIDWDKFLPRFGLFRAQEQQSRARHGF